MLKADKLMYETIQRILKEGFKDENPRPRWKDGTPAHTYSVNHMIHQYDIYRGEFPITTLRPIAVKNGIGEILAIYQGQTNVLDDFRDQYGFDWWRDWESKDQPGTIGQRYGATVAKYDLMNKLLKDLKNDPFGRRHIISLWQESDFQDTDGLMPCAFQTIWNVRKWKGEMFLDLMLTQRSSDWLVAGNINQTQYVALLMMVAQHCGYTPGVFTHVMANVQIYDRHLEQAILLSRRYEEKKETEDKYGSSLLISPRLSLKQGKNFYEITKDDFTIDYYTPMKPQLKFEVAI